MVASATTPLTPPKIPSIDEATPAADSHPALVLGDPSESNWASTHSTKTPLPLSLSWGAESNASSVAPYSPSDLNSSAPLTQDEPKDSHLMIHQPILVVMHPMLQATPMCKQRPWLLLARSNGHRKSLGQNCGRETQPSVGVNNQVNTNRSVGSSKPNYIATDAPDIDTTQLYEMLQPSKVKTRKCHQATLDSDPVCFRSDHGTAKCRTLSAATIALLFKDMGCPPVTERHQPLQGQMRRTLNPPRSNHPVPLAPIPRFTQSLRMLHPNQLSV